MIFFVPILALVCSYLYAQLNVNETLWAFMSCTFVALILFTVWSYKKYDKNIKSILQSLDMISFLIYLIYVISDMDMFFNMERDNKKQVKKCHFCHLFLKLSR